MPRKTFLGLGNGIFHEKKMVFRDRDGHALSDREGSSENLSDVRVNAGLLVRGNLMAMQAFMSALERTPRGVRSATCICSIQVHSASSREVSEA